jgi:hypothetical protein
MSENKAGGEYVNSICSVPCGLHGGCRYANDVANGHSQRRWRKVDIYDDL